MKSLSLFAVSTSLVGLALIGCERHSFDVTQKLHMEHGAHHDEHHGEESHGKEEGHHGKDSHVEKEHGVEKTKEAHPEAAKEEPRKTGI
jgi:hypothetical protein